MLASTTAFRLGVFAELAEVSPSAFGRTALMKLCYFLQILKGVPLGYDFTLYSYGPFDSEVLSDLQTAESLSVLESSLSYYSGGYSYRIVKSDNSRAAIENVHDLVQRYKRDIDWVAEKFSSRSAAELELLSTIIFVNTNDKTKEAARLLTAVKKIKPHFSDGEISKKIRWLDSESLLA